MMPPEAIPTPAEQATLEQLDLPLPAVPAKPARTLFFELKSRKFVETQDPALIELLRSKGVPEVGGYECWEHLFQQVKAGASAKDSSL